MYRDNYSYSVRKKSGKSGFTIVELLITIIVIAILASISIVAYTGIQERAKRTKLQVALKQYQTIIRLTDDTDINSIGLTCLGQPSDYPATDTMPAGVCVSGEDTPHVMQVPLSLSTPTYTILSQQGPPPSVDASSIATTPNFVQFRGMAIVHGSNPESGAMTMILYKEPPGGCLNGDTSTSSFPANGSYPLRWWALDGACAHDIEDTRITCRDTPTSPPPFDAIRASMGC